MAEKTAVDELHSGACATNGKICMAQMGDVMTAGISGQLLRVETVSGTDGLHHLRQEWNCLLQQSDADCLFLTWEWLATWWKHLSGDRELSIMSVRRERN